MNEQSGATKWIGQSVERLEDPPLVTGRGRFAGDINFPRQLHMRIVRSNHAHANIVSIDTEAARALPGVVAVWTAADIADVPPIDFREGPIEKLAPYRQPVLAMRQGALCRRAGRGGVRRGPLRRRGRRRSRHHGGRGTAAAARRARRARRVLVRPRHRGRRSCTQGYGDVDAVFKSARAYRRAEAHQRPALRRAAGMPRRASAATTPRATCWSCTAPRRCRTGTRS